ncbi:MAG: hypothetical protein GTO15_06410 [Pseudomonas stutzeri]|nr:hypothetical protein [Stutzerimonas stutzeri]
MWVAGPEDRGLCYEIGIWYDPDAARRRLAEIVIEREEKKPAELRHKGVILWVRHVMEGWRPVFRVEGRMPDLRDVAEFRERDWRFRHQFNRELRELERHATGEVAREEADKAFRAHVEDFATDEYPAICRARTSHAFDGWAERFGTRWNKEEEQ